MRAPHYALWLLLPPPERARFGALIRTLAEQHGTPPFEPHITLLGGIDAAPPAALSAGAALARRIAPLPIRLAHIGQRDSFYQCLFVHAVADPALRRAHREARATFAREEGGEFLPHLSLVYGDLRPAQKAAIVTQLGARLEAEFRVEELALIRYRKEDRPQDWQRVATFRLGGDAPA